MTEPAKKKPYHYQELVDQCGLAGQDILLQAPTGAGKTRAALMPGIHGFARDRDTQLSKYPPRILYGVPMRVLARSFQHEYTETAQGLRDNTPWESHWHPSIQTGEQPEDPLFESRVIFATVDQLLASFLTLPYSLPGRLANINTGVLVGAYLVFDEFHLYPRDQMMLTTLAMLKMLKGVSRFNLMTATFSEPLLHGIAGLLGAEVIANAPDTPLEDGLFADIDRLRGQTRTWQTQPGILTGAAAADLIGGAKRAMVLCNTVDRAQALYQDLRRTLPDHDVVLLHSRFYRSDRRAIEDRVLASLGKESGEDSLHRPMVLVATQVVEVGLDISCDVLISECAPAASLIQRAGRCARWPREGGGPAEGQVHIFQPFDAEGQVSYAPYIDEGNEEICYNTWQELNTPRFDGAVMRFPQEQQLITAAHGAADKAFVSNLEEMIRIRIGEITDCLANRDRGWLGSLIRENTSVPLYVAAKPNDDDTMTSKPWNVEAFSVSRGQVARLMNNALEVGVDADTPLWGGALIREEDSEQPYARSVFRWDGLREGKDAYGHSYTQFAAHPEAISYSSDLGLAFYPGQYQAEGQRVETRNDYERPLYHAERYYEHIHGLYLAYTRPIQTGKRALSALQGEFLYPLGRMCTRIGLNAEQGEQVMRLTLALHDIGKLNQPWQAWCRAWQQERVRRGGRVGIDLDDPAPLAHTDFDTASIQERTWQKELKHAPRGTHAVESAQAAAGLLWDVVEDDLWVSVALAAIMRHHTPDAESCGPFRMVDGGPDAAQQALELCGFEANAGPMAGQLQREFRHSGTDLEDALDMLMPHRTEYLPALMYLLFVRVLRLADQRSGYYWQKYKDDV